MNKPTLFGRTGRAIDWAAWEAVIQQNGITIDRPRRSRHPHFREIVYPIDYGYVNGTLGADGEEIDIFVGSAHTLLVALIATADFRKGDEEVKLIYNCTPEEVYLVNGFINFDPTLMQGRLVMRRPLGTLWDPEPPAAAP